MQNKECAVIGMGIFANSHNFNSTGQAPVARFFVNHLFLHFENLIPQFHALTDYSYWAPKFSLAHVIWNTIESHELLVDVIRSVVLKFDYPADYKTYITFKLQAKCELLKTEALNTVKRYKSEMKPAILKFVLDDDLNDLKIKIWKKTDFSFF